MLYTLVCFFTLAVLPQATEAVPFVIAEKSDSLLAPADPVCSDFFCGGYDTLHYDGNNATGIGMSGGGWFKAGVRFTAPYRCILKSILFYQFDYALTGYIFMYGQGTSARPGTLWDSVPFYPVAPKSWVCTDMPWERFLAPGTDFWACPEIACARDRFPMGLDSGPMVGDRNFIYWDDRIGWVQLDRVGSDRNWNIRAVIARAESRDVCPTAVLAPAAQTWPGPIAPKVRIRNIGEQAESDIPVTVRIDSAGTRLYEQTLVLPGPVAPGAYTVATLPVWHPGPKGAEYNITAFTALPADLNLANDTITATARIAGAAFTDTLVAKRISGSPPTIDGTVEEREWAEARAYDVSDTSGQGLTRRPPGSNIVRFLYDGNYLYVASEFPTVSERQDGDCFALCTDEDRSGNWKRTDSSEGRHTALYVAGRDSLIFEAILTTLPYMWRMEGQCPGALSASGTAGGHLQFEAKIPLGSRRGDLALSPGDTAGVFLYSMAGYGSDCYGWWPQRVTQGEWAKPALYSPLVLSTEIGVEEERSTPHASLLTLEICPNPVSSGLVRMRLSPAQRSSLSAQRFLLRLYDASGRCVLSESFVIRTSDFALPLDCRSLSSGVYLLRLDTETGTASARLVIPD